jgi:hypothetical protein
MDMSAYKSRWQAAIQVKGCRENGQQCCLPPRFFAVQ